MNKHVHACGTGLANVYNQVLAIAMSICALIIVHDTCEILTSHACTITSWFGLIATTSTCDMRTAWNLYIAVLCKHELMSNYMNSYM